MDVEERLGRVEERLEAMQEDTTTIRKAIVGSSGNPGLLIRVDRLEQLESRRKWVIRTLIVASLAAVAGVILLLLRVLLMG